MAKRNVLITGTSRGIGKALAEHFLEEGDIVFGCARTGGNILHDNYHHSVLDISLEDEVAGLFYDIREKISKLDILVNNAGVANMNAFALTPVDTVRKIFDVNVIGSFCMSQKAIQLLRKSKYPRIINMTTVAVPLQLEGEAAYAASKSAIETLTQVMAKELGRFGITCNALGPAPILTDLIKNVSKEKIDNLIKKQAVKRMATIDDVINVVEFFAKPDSSMVSGQVIYLGGVSR